MQSFIISPALASLSAVGGLLCEPLGGPINNLLYTGGWRSRVVLYITCHVRKQTRRPQAGAFGYDYVLHVHQIFTMQLQRNSLHVCQARV